MGDHPAPGHILDNDVIAAAQDRRPNIAKHFRCAKLILQQCSNETGDNLFDHLSEIIKNVLDERPPDVVDYFEEYSRKIKESKLRTNDLHLEDSYVEPDRLNAAKKILPYLKVPAPPDFPGGPVQEEATGEDEERQEPLIKDVMHLQFYWNFVGIGFPQDQMFLLSAAMRKLEENPIIVDCFFWGIIYGLQNNYYVVEANLSEEENDRRNELEGQEREKEKEHEKDAGKPVLTVEQQITLNASLFPKPRPPSIPSALPPPGEPTEPTVPPAPLKPRPIVAKIPESDFKTKKDIPAEYPGYGLNRKAYFVCNSPGDDWVELPSVTPKQIVVARKITKYFTGDLCSQIKSYPTFPGTEKNYLRAQIARISAATHVSPIGCFKIGEGDDEEEEEDEGDEGDNDKATNQDPNYEPISIKELQNLSNWVHHKPNILKQGRIKWFDENLLENEDENEEEGEDEGEDENKIPPEEGPPLMSPCSEDAAMETIPAWTIRLTTICNPKNSMCMIKSNFWPGALSFTFQRIQSNIYIGFGQKLNVRNYSPPPIPAIGEEYPIGPEILEINDPTIEEEEAWRIAHEKPLIEPEGEEEGDMEGDMDDYDDDDDEDY